MKKITLVLAVLFTLNLSAGPLVKSWQCNDILVTFNFIDNTMKVGELVYDADWPSENVMVLRHGDIDMFQVTKDGNGGLIFKYTINGVVYNKHFIKCN